MKQNKPDHIVQYLIPPSLVLLLIVTIYELFYNVEKLKLFIDVIDMYVIIIFAIDLYYRWQETKNFKIYVKRYFLDIIATIPFNLIFLSVEGLVLLQGLRGIRIATQSLRVLRFARYARLLRLLRVAARLPRFLRMRKHLKKVKPRKIQPHEKEMKGVLSFKVILLVTINSIMGTGIWFLTSAGAKYAGPASLISWGVLSLISLYIAMCFSELTAMFPKAGGVYEFAKQTYGRFWSFVIGWTTSIAGSVTIAMLLLGALQYLIPQQYSFSYIPAALILIILFNYVAYKGMRTSTFVLVTFAILTLATITIILIPGFFNLNVENYTPFFVFPSLSIILTIFFIAETFFGWESAIFLSAETKNPTKVMPKALIYGTLVIAVLSFSLAFTSLGVIPWEKYAESATPLSDLGGSHFGLPGKIIFTILVAVSILGAVASWIVTAPRLLMAIAEDKLFFVQFAKIHPKYKSPYISVIFQAIVISLLVIIGAGSYVTLLHMLIPLILIVYSAVLLSVVILRFRKPELHRPYKVLFGKFGPFVTIIFMIFLLMMFIKETHGAWNILRISASLIAFGIPAYFAIELFYDQKYVILRRNLGAKLRHYYHTLPLSQRTFNTILSYAAGTNKDTVIIDFNSPMGAFTRMLLKRKKPFKKSIILNSSKEELNLIKENVASPKIVPQRISNLNNVRITTRADIVISFNNIGYAKDISRFLRSVRSALEKRGRFCLYTSQHLLNMMPNALLLENKQELKKIFDAEKLTFTYIRKKRILKEEIFIYGRKK